MGVVYEAFDPTKERSVAVKIVRVPESPQALSIALDEARMLARLAHPNVVFLYGAESSSDGLVLVMDDHGVLAMAEATPRGYKRLGRHEVFPDGHDAWGPMALVGGRLIVRDMTRMVCLDVAHPAG